MIHISFCLQINKGCPTSRVVKFHDILLRIVSGHPLHFRANFAPVASILTRKCCPAVTTPQAKLPTNILMAGTWDRSSTTPSRSWRNKESSSRRSYEPRRNSSPSRRDYPHQGSFRVADHSTGIMSITDNDSTSSSVRVNNALNAHGRNLSLHSTPRTPSSNPLTRETSAAHTVVEE